MTLTKTLIQGVLKRISMLEPCVVISPTRERSVEVFRTVASLLLSDEVIATFDSLEIKPHLRGVVVGNLLCLLCTAQEDVHTAGVPHSMHIIFDSGMKRDMWLGLF